jgi:hypothetical protein
MPRSLCEKTGWSAARGGPVRQRSAGQQEIGQAALVRDGEPRAGHRYRRDVRHRGQQPRLAGDLRGPGGRVRRVAEPHDQLAADQVGHVVRALAEGDHVVDRIAGRLGAHPGAARRWPGRARMVPRRDPDGSSGRKGRA